MLGFTDFQKLTSPPSHQAVEYNTNQAPIESLEACASPTNEQPPYLTPEVYWSQTDTTVKLKIKLIGVEDYKVNLTRKKILTFRLVLGGCVDGWYIFFVVLRWTTRSMA